MMGYFLIDHPKEFSLYIISIKDNQTLKNDLGK